MKYFIVYIKIRNNIIMFDMIVTIIHTLMVE